MPFSPGERDAWLNLDFENAFNTFYAPHLGGARGQRPFGRWLSGQLGQMKNQFTGALGNDPTGTLNFMTWLGQQQDPMAQWGNLTPQGRGETPGRFQPALSWRGLFGSR